MFIFRPKSITFPNLIFTLKILKNISSRAAYMLTEDRQLISVSIEDCIENQKMVLELYERLVEMGEIIGTEE